jgi:hypothetical protein
MTPDPFDHLHDEFHAAAEALGRTHDALTVAHAGVVDAVGRLLRAVDAGRQARTEREDLRDTVRHLEALVMQYMGAAVRALRERNGGAS